VDLAGIDVSAKTLVVKVERSGKQELLEFENTGAGHQKLIALLCKRRRSARVCLEATGIYGLDLALALHAAPRIEVMVANPRATKKFAEASLQRGKSDVLDAGAILEYVRRMPFVPWTAPAPEALELRSISRRIEGLVKMQTQEKNRLHAAMQSSALPVAVRADVEESIASLDDRIRRLRRQAVALLRAHHRLSRAFDQLQSVRGIADAAAIQILAELLVLPEDMTARQWVAHAGLDPRQKQSGTSLHARPRISKAGNKHLRRALFMPALVAAQWEPQVRAFYQHLLANGKTKMQANIAVMRKLLHAIYGMLRHGDDFCGVKFYALIT